MSSHKSGAANPVITPPTEIDMVILQAVNVVSPITTPQHMCASVTASVLSTANAVYVAPCTISKSDFATSSVYSLPDTFRVFAKSDVPPVSKTSVELLATILDIGPLTAPVTISEQTASSKNTISVVEPNVLICNVSPSVTVSVYHTPQNT